MSSLRIPQGKECARAEGACIRLGFDPCAFKIRGVCVGVSKHESWCTKPEPKPGEISFAAIDQTTLARECPDSPTCPAHFASVYGSSSERVADTAQCLIGVTPFGSPAPQKARIGLLRPVIPVWVPHFAATGKRRRAPGRPASFVWS